ncbi:unnamed protein product, partial [Polarella glacialis]
EFFPDNNENQGRPVAELRCCPVLRELRAWPAVRKALSDEATVDWREKWDSEWARGDGWQEHCGAGCRLDSYADWLASRPETMVAVVCHFGTINNILNSEPWAKGLPRSGDPTRWPCGGLAKRFAVPNCGWVAALSSERWCVCLVFVFVL